MKKLFLILISFILLLNLTSAGDWTSIDNYKDYYPEENKIVIGDWNLLSPDKTLAEYTLLSNTDQCLINCEAKVRQELMYDDYLLSDLRVYNSKDQIVSIKDLSISYLDEEEYYVDVPVYKKVCEDTIDNKTLETREECWDEVIGTEKELKIRLIEVIYNYSVMEAGTYDLIIKGRKDVNQRVDWRIEAFGQELSEWAWWNASWNYCANINVTQGYDFTGRTGVAIVNLDGTNIEDDGSDVRFVNTSCHDGGTEVPYNIISANATDVRVSFEANVTGTGGTNYAVYYGNALATTTKTAKLPIYLSNETNIFLQSGVASPWNLTATSGDGIKLQSGGMGGYWGGGDYGLSSYGTDAWTGSARSTTFYLGDTIYYQGRDSSGSDNYWIDVGDDLSTEITITNIEIGATDPPPTFSTSTSSYKGRFASLYLLDDMTGAGGWLTFTKAYTTLDGQNLSSYPLTTTLGAEEDVDNFVVTTTINSPVSGTNTSSSTLTISANGTATNGNLTNITGELYNSTGSLVFSNLTTWTGTSNTTSVTIVMPYDGTFTFNALACGENSTTTLCDYDTNRTITLDTTAPVLNITYPTGIFSYGYVNKTEQLNFTVIDAISNIDTCWYSVNSGTNTTFTSLCNSTANVNVSGFANATNINNIIRVCANDTLNNLNCVNTIFNYTVFQHSLAYTTPVAKTSLQNFILNASILPSYTLSYSTFKYYNSSYVSTITDSGSSKIISNNIQIPSYYNNYSFYYNLTLTNSTSTTYVASSAYIQNVTNITFVLCDYSLYNTTSLNFTIYDETTSAELNAFLETSLTYWSGGSGDVSEGYNFANYTNNTNYPFCVDPAYSSFQLSGVVSYYQTDYDRREYFFSNATVNNITQNIDLYLLGTAVSDIFTVTVVDENEEVVEEAYVYVQKWDIGTGNFYNVGVLKTGEDGTASINMRLTDVWYRFIVVYNGVTYLTTEPAKETETSRTLTINLETINPYLYFDGLTYSLTFNNNTNTFTFVYTDITGVTQTGCLRVLSLKNNATTVNSLSCLDTVSATISSSITENGTYTAQGIVYLSDSYDNTYKVLIDLTRTIGTPARFLIFKSYGQIISLMLIGTLAMVGVAAGSIILGLGLIIVGLAITNILGWINITTTVLYGLISIIIIILVTLKRKYG